MLVMDSVSSLNLVKAEIELTLSEGMGQLEAYSQAQAEMHVLHDALGHFDQVQGVLKLIALQGAAQLLEEICTLVRYFMRSESEQSEIDQGLQVVGQGLVHLLRYMEQVQSRQRAEAVLIMPSVNIVRKTLGKSLLTESDFIPMPEPAALDLHHLADDLNDPPASFDEVKTKGKRLRHMYQVGMLGVFNGEHARVNLKIMSQAMSRMIGLCGRSKVSCFWWTVKAMLHALLDAKLPLNDSRKVVLGKIDRTLKQFLSGHSDGLDMLVTGKLLKECLVIIGLSNSDEMLVKKTKNLYRLHLGLDEATLLMEMQAMGGPTGSVMLTVSTAITDDLNQVKDHLDLATRGVLVDHSYHDTAEIMFKVSRTLMMLNQTKAASALQDEAERIDAKSNQSEVLQSEEYNRAADVILLVENALSKLQSSAVAPSHMDTEKENSKISWSQLEQASHLVVVESRVGIAVAKRAISSYIDSHCDDLHLANIPASLESIAGALRFLKLDRAALLLIFCVSFIKSDLVGFDKQPDRQQLEILADALSSVDYFLEGLEDGKPIGEGVLAVAEESIEELGLDIS